MRYVSFRSSFITQRLLIAAVCFFANASQPAFGDMGAEADANAGAQPPIHDLLLSDEQISQNCKASIDNHYDMITVADGDGAQRTIPRCVFTYEHMRDVAQRYTNSQQAAVDSLKRAASPANCEHNTTQLGCVQAGQDLNKAAATAHQSMATAAEEAAQDLELFAGNNHGPGQ
jgi:hypothetical protein